MVVTLPELGSRRLALKFAALILLFSSSIAAVITLAELAMEYREDVRSVDQRMQQIEVSYLDSLVENLWVMDRERLETQLQGIVRLPDFVLAEIRVDHRTYMRQGTPLEGGGITRQFELRHPYRGETQKLGLLVVSASYQEAYERVLGHLLFRLVANVVKTLLVGAFIFVLFYRLIGRHLDRIVDYAGDPTPEVKKPPLALARTAPVVDDELTKLVSAINRARAELLYLLEEAQERSDSYEKQTTLLRQELLARKKIQRELDLMARVFEDSVDAILLTDAERRIAAVNDAFTRLTGYERADVLGHNPRMLASGETDPQAYRTLWESLDRTGVWEGVVQNRCKDGSLLAVRLVITVVRDRDDRITNYIGVYLRAGAPAIS